jgi:hypothetical protein
MVAASHRVAFGGGKLFLPLRAAVPQQQANLHMTILKGMPAAVYNSSYVTHFTRGAHGVNNSLVLVPGGVL